MSRIYLDNNATTAPIDEVAKEIYNLMKMPYNSSAVHSIGREAKAIIDSARSKVLDVLHVKNKQDYQVIFTATGTEANNLAIQGVNADHYYASSTEHMSVLNPIKTRKKHSFISVDASGILNLAELEEKLAAEKERKFISIQFANNETGVVQDIEKITEIAKKYDAIIHSDMVQAIGKIDCKMQDLDMISMSAHKFGGPQGVGVLVAKKSIPIWQIMHGGAQEMSLRPGTVNVRGVAGLKVALDNIERRLAQNAALLNLRQRIESFFANKAYIHAQNVRRLDNTISVSMPKVDNNTQLMFFDLAGICLSSGAACSSGKVATSHVLKAMNIKEEIARNTIRISLGVDNTEAEIDQFLNEWENLYSKHNKKELV